MKQRAKRLGAALRRGMALSVAVALVCSMALGASALEMDVLNEDTGLIETLEFDDDEYPVAIFEEEETPAEEEEPTEEPDDTETADEELDDTEEETPDEETKEDSTEEKDTEEADDEEEFLVDTDFVKDDIDFDSYETAFAESAEDNTYYYYEEKVYSEESHTNEVGRSLSEIVNTATKEITIYMDSTCYTKGSNVTLEPTCDVYLKRNTEKRMFIVDGGTLTLGGKSGMLDIDSTGFGSVEDLMPILVQGEGTLNIYDRTKVHGCTGIHTRGGAVWIVNGTVNMYGGELSGNETQLNGGGILIDNTSIFNMSGGTISNNTSTNGNGSGVCISGSGTFNMSGGTISGNTAKNGGGVYMSGGEFNMTGGTIGDENDTTNRNTASEYGGGVYVSGGTFTMSRDAVIAGNTSVADGAGVYLGGPTSSGKLIMQGGKITGNEVTGAGHYGGGIGGYGDFEMSGGVITKNKSQYSSGISKPAGTFKISGGTIADNEFTGGGTNEVSISGNMTIKGGSVKGINDQGYPERVTDGYKQLSQYVVSGLTNGVQYDNLKVKYILDGKLVEYDCGKDIYADSEGKVYPWLPEGSILVSASGGGTVPIPQISISVPVSMTVTINPAGGECEIGVGNNQAFTVGDGNQDAYNTYTVATYSENSGASAIQNNSAVPIYLTSVTFTWNADEGTTSDGKKTPAPSEIFTNWSSDTDDRPIIKLNNAPGTVDGNTITWTPNKKLDANNGTCDLTWSFDLNGNSITQALNADVAAPIGTIVYTVSYQNPNPTSTQDDDFYIYEYENGGDAA